ncbi:MAG TPA: hypothetical protein VHM19_00275 [Polyangiales bacterium]|jgi:ABC-type phosphate transport system substrate-binding protein|nr:hypothetical protein [Polyangiales bacterium]
MRSPIPRLLLCTILALTAAVAPAHLLAQNEQGSAAQAPEVLAVIVNPATKVSRLSVDELAAVFTMSERRWDDGKAIVVFNLPSRTSQRESFDAAVLGMDASEVARFWIDQRIRGKGEAPIKVPTPAMMVQVVAKLPGSIGYVPLSAVTPQVKVVARVAGGKVLAP